MNSRRRWADLSPRTRALITAAGVVQIGLLVAALADIRRRDPAEVRGPRWAWALASFVNFVGPILYFLTGRRRGGA
ncbi:PLD nuclease N-terminal domain-containing protein [Pseudonocardia sp.]|uniref:PLD nuclease N-terminal domain-containing protein n=1 Tax=Pseudonocardia sp. TaxID=60912 RepID=UPI003D115EDF